MIENNQKTALILINIGTPEQPTVRAVRRYLRVFLSDKNIVDIPYFLWLPILYSIILPLRAYKSARKYRSIWRLEGSPLAFFTQRLVQRLIQYRQNQPGKVLLIRAAMRYTTAPARLVYANSSSIQDIASTIQQLSAQGVGKILFWPLYPQYARSTTKSAVEVALQASLQLAQVPAIRTISAYYQHPAYLCALRTQIEQYWQQHGCPNFAAGARLLLSFHGVPKRTILRGDPYYQHCYQTYQLLIQELQLTEHAVQLVFQSRFGKAKWLEPSLADVLQQLADASCPRVDIFCPGFAADCLETLEEIDQAERAHFFRVSKGECAFHYIPCLNDSPHWVEALSEMVDQQIGDW